MTRIRLVNDFFDPLVELLRPISPLALFLLAILWFSIGDGSKIFVIALAASSPVILNTFAGTRSIDANLIRASRSLGATELEIFQGDRPAGQPALHLYGSAAGLGHFADRDHRRGDGGGYGRHGLDGAGGAADVSH